MYVDSKPSHKYLVILKGQTISVICQLSLSSVPEKQHKPFLRRRQPTPLGVKRVLLEDDMSTHTKLLAFHESFLGG